MISNRRDWFKQSFLATTGLALFPLAQQSWLNSHASWADQLLSLNASEEAYWTLVKSGFPLQEGLKYFNNASLGPSPKMVIDATNRFRALLDGYPSKYMWYAWKEEKEAVRKKMAALLKVDPETIALTHNTTEGMNLVASSLELASGDEVILANHEHHTGTIPWKYHQESKGIKLVRPILPILPKNDDEIVEIYLKAITSKTKVISLVHMTNTNGMILPIKAISQMAHERGILVAVDGAQTLGMLDLNLEELECDFYAGSCHKWLYGPKGTGVFYAKPAAQKHLKAMIVCSGYKDPSIRRLENYNTRNYPELLGVGTALDFNDLVGTANKQKRIYELKHFFLEKLNTHDQFVVKTPVSDHQSAGIITVEIKGKAVKEVQKALADQFEIDCRPMTTHELNGLRISLSIFNTKTDVEHLVECMLKV